MPSPNIRILPDPNALFNAAAADFVSIANAAIADHKRFTVALSGGSTPRGLFSLLASGAIAGVPWKDIFFFWGDERHVPPDSSESNYRMANDAMLSKVPVPTGNIFRVPAEGTDAKSVATSYERSISAFFDSKVSEMPRFDLVMLGMGPDGHTASLFPGTDALKETERIFVANWVAKMNDFRFTLTYPAINNAAQIMFLVAGADKAEMVDRILGKQDEGLPAAKIRPSNGKLLWFLDQAAAKNLSTEERL